MKKKLKAFTLIEILIVVAIIAILAVVVIVSYSEAKAKSRDSKRISDLNAISSALNLYHESNGKFPCNPLLSPNTCPETSGYVGETSCIIGVGPHPRPEHQYCLKSLVDQNFIAVLPHDPYTTDDDITANLVSCSTTGGDHGRCYAYNDQQWGSGAALFTRLENYTGSGMAGSWRKPTVTGLACDPVASNYYCLFLYSND